MTSKMLLIAVCGVWWWCVYLWRCAVPSDVYVCMYLLKQCNAYNGMHAAIKEMMHIVIIFSFMILMLLLLLLLLLVSYDLLQFLFIYKTVVYLLKSVSGLYISEIVLFLPFSFGRWNYSKNNVQCCHHDLTANA